MLNTRDIEKLYEENFDRIYKFFYFKTLSKEIAEDLTSETFISFVQIIKSQKEIDNLQAFLYGIAKNIFLKYLKRKYQDGIPFSMFEGEFENQAEASVESKAHKQTLEELAMPYIENLPEKQRLILQLRFIEKYSLKAICEKIGKDMNYVKTTQKRGLANLKKLAETGRTEGEQESSIKES